MGIVSKENLKLIVENGGVFCDSRELAKQFDKQHKNILQIIEREVERFGELKFKPSKIKEYFIEDVYYAGKNKKSYKRYKLTFKGFQQIALQLTGKKAFVNRIKFIDFFEELIKSVSEDKLIAIKNKLDAEWEAVREQGKKERKKLTEAIKLKVIKYREDVERKLNDGKYYQNYTKLIYKKLGIDLPKGANPRDILDKKTLIKLDILEDMVADWILESDEYYKDTYKTIKNRLGL